MCAAAGHVRDVVYLGMYTRYRVELDGGGDLAVVAQNLDSTSMEALDTIGRRVKLVWQPIHNQVLEQSGGV
jgi:putative spermidine/putrescine transport system ATP-binding protein